MNDSSLLVRDAMGLPLRLSEILADGIGSPRTSSVEEAIQAFFWNAEDGVAIFSPEGRLLVYNSAFIERSGLSVAQLAGADMRMIQQQMTQSTVAPERDATRSKMDFHIRHNSEHGFSSLELFPAEVRSGSE